MIDGHGDDLHRYTNIRANFSSNVYEGTNNTSLIDYLQHRLPWMLGSYPEPEPYTLQHLLSQALEISANQCAVTSGATEGIYLVAQAYQRSCSYILTPCFAEYADACQLHHHTIHYITQLDDIGTTPGLVWICNPNNPTGQTLPKKDIEATIQRYPQHTFVLDQSYAYYTPQPLLSPKEITESYPNVILIHSLTKRYRIPGIRLGYLVASTELILQIRPCRLPWSVNAVALEAGLWIVNQGFPDSIDLPQLWQATQQLAEVLSQLPQLIVYPSNTHILLLKCQAMAASILKEQLAQEYGILIRDAGNFVGLGAHHFRIATQSRTSNTLLINALREILH